MYRSSKVHHGEEDFWNPQPGRGLVHSIGCICKAVDVGKKIGQHRREEEMGFHFLGNMFDEEGKIASAKESMGQLVMRWDLSGN